MSTIKIRVIETIPYIETTINHTYLKAYIKVLYKGFKINIDTSKI